MILKDDFKSYQIPNNTGIYLFRDKNSNIIYVGKAKSLRKRLSSYFQYISPSEKKLHSMVKSIYSLEFIVSKNEKEALVLENKMIKQYQPKYNILLRDDKFFFMIKIDIQNPYPKLVLSRTKIKDKSLYFGPFPNSKLLKSTISYLIKHYRIRSCTPLIPDKKDKKHCLDHIIKSCSSPCDNTTSEQDYKKQINSLVAVLNGNNHLLISQLKEKMLIYSDNFQYEKAQYIKDIISGIKQLSLNIRSFQRYNINQIDDPKYILNELQKTLSLKNFPLIIECFDNSNFQGSYAVSSMVQFYNAKPNKKNYRRFTIKTVNGIDDFASMFEVVSRRLTRIINNSSSSLPNLILIDGGLGQLQSAFKALRKLNLQNKIDIYALAKRNEELFSINNNIPLILDKNNIVLKLLQFIRDESHRFAIDFHRQYRDKQISNSALDIIPQIGIKRKVLLLNKFKSVANIKKQTPKNIANQVPGISFKIAENIIAFLNK